MGSSRINVCPFFRWSYQQNDTYDTTFCAIFTENLPTLVPPNFCTNHFAFGSMVFWCRFGGVLGGDDDEKEELLENGGVAGGVAAGLVIEKRRRMRVLSSDVLLL